MDIQQHEEAAKALELGKKALEINSFERAAKLFEKSLRMRKTAEAEALLTCARKGVARAEAKATAAAATPSSNGVHARHPVKHDAPPSDRPFTPEQEKSCKLIISAKSHYETLSIERTASSDEIKKAYRKTALKFHPDKCGAPSADEAFKKVSKAFKMLADPDERAHYDRYGEDERVGMVGGGNGSGHRHAGGFGGQPGGFDMDADDLLRWFMSGGMAGGQTPGGARVHHFGTPRGVYQQQQQHRAGVRPGGVHVVQSGTLFQQIASLVMFLVFLFNAWGGSTTPGGASGGNTPYRAQNQFFSLAPDTHFTVKRTTTMNGIVPDIQYFVDSRFSGTIGKTPRDLYYVESAVQTTLNGALKEKCQYETTVKTEHLNQARRTGDQQAFTEAAAMETPSCGRLQELEKKIRLLR